MELELTRGKWINEPTQKSVNSHSIKITTDPETDFWQRSYYGFRNDNAPALLFDCCENFTLTAKAQFEYKELFDQCGLIIYLDSENWFKASIEYENTAFSRLGSVVTNNGYSDWATSDIETPAFIWYRLHRRGPDFLIESSFDGVNFKQMRVFHLHQLGETTAVMGKTNPPLPAKHSIRFGFYACSPSVSSFTASFTNIQLEACKWLAHGSSADGE